MMTLCVLAFALNQIAPPGTLAESEALAKKVVASWQAASQPKSTPIQSIALLEGVVNENTNEGERTFSTKTWKVAFRTYSSTIEFNAEIGRFAGSHLPDQRLEKIGKEILSEFVGRRVDIRLKEKSTDSLDYSTATYDCEFSYLGYPFRWELGKLTLVRSTGFPLKIQFPSYLHNVRFPSLSNAPLKDAMSITQSEEQCERVYLATGAFAEATSSKGFAYWRPEPLVERIESQIYEIPTDKPLIARLYYQKHFSAELRSGEDDRQISVDSVTGQPLQPFDMMASMVIKIGYQEPDLLGVMAHSVIRIIGPRRTLAKRVLSIEKAKSDERGKTVLIQLSNGRYYSCKYLGLGSFYVKGNLVTTNIKTWELDGLLAEPLIKVPGIVQ